MHSYDRTCQLFAHTPFKPAFSAFPSESSFEKAPLKALPNPAKLVLEETQLLLVLGTMANPEDGATSPAKSATKRTTMDERRKEVMVTVARIVNSVTTTKAKGEQAVKTEVVVVVVCVSTSGGCEMRADVREKKCQRGSSSESHVVSRAANSVKMKMRRRTRSD